MLYVHASKSAIRGKYSLGRGLRRPGPRLAGETLESRCLLATDFGGVQGHVFNDLDSDGVFDAGEPGLAGIGVRLFQGTTTIRTGTTDGNGRYAFSGLTAGTYQVEQLSTPAGFVITPGFSPATAVITAAEAAGIPGTVVDLFDGVTQTLNAINGGSDQSSVADPDALGGRRDLFVEVLNNPGGAAFHSNLVSNPDFLSFDPDNNSRGHYLATWDGDATPTTDAAGTLNATGLGGVDLTSGGTISAFRLLAGIDGGGQNLEIRIYSNAANFSVFTVSLPDTGGPANQEVIVPFSAFVTGGGTGANFSSVGAVQLEHTATMVAADGGISELTTLGTNFVTRDFPNTSNTDLRLAKSVDDGTPLLNANVTFTLTLTNDGPADATGVQVRDQLPAGLTFQSSAPSQGSYSAVTGLWNVGTLDLNDTATLQIVARVATAGTKINDAAITAVNPADRNPNNNSARATVTPDVTPGISLVKATSGRAAETATGGPTVFVGTRVTFGYTVTNTGNVALSGVVVQDDNGSAGNAADDFFASYNSGDTNNNRQLDLGETWLFTAARTATVGTHVNRATATATGANIEVSDDSVSNHTGLALPRPFGKRRFLASRFR